MCPLDIAIKTLDEVLQELAIEAVHGLKIDVEGVELEVLEGFRRWLVEKPPSFIFLECIENHLARFGSNAEDLFGSSRSIIAISIACFGADGAPLDHDMIIKSASCHRIFWLSGHLSSEK